MQCETKLVSPTLFARFWTAPREFCCCFSYEGESCLYLLVIYERKHEFLVWSASEDNSLHPLCTGNTWSESFGSIYENWCGNLILFYGW